jgi:hypothetical protein
MKGDEFVYQLSEYQCRKDPAAWSEGGNWEGGVETSDCNCRESGTFSVLIIQTNGELIMFVTVRFINSTLLLNCLDC